MDEMTSRAFQALGNPHRLKIVRWLVERALACCTGDRVEDCTMDPASCNAGELVEAVDVAPSTLSHHLKELEHAGLVERVREGRYIYCRVNEERLVELSRFLETGAVAAGGGCGCCGPASGDGTSRTVGKAESVSKGEAPADLTPIACTLSPEAAEAWRAEMPGLLTELEEVRELEDGYALRYDGAGDWEERLRMLADFIEGERKCCRFFRFEIVLEPERGPIWLNLRGRPGVKEYFRAELIELGVEDEVRDAAATAGTTT